MENEKQKQSKFKRMLKSTPFLLLMFVVVAGIGTAAILPYIGTVEQTVNVKQGLTLDGHAYDDPVEDNLTDSEQAWSTSETTYVDSHNLSNKAPEDTEVNVVRTDCDADSTQNSCEEINTSYYDVTNPVEDVSFGESSLTRTYDKGTKMVTFDVDTNLSCDYPNDGFANVYIDNDNDGNVDFQIENTVCTASEITLWKYDGSSWESVWTEDNNVDTTSIPNTGIKVDEDEKSVSIPVKGDEYNTGTEFKYSIQTSNEDNTDNYASGDVSWKKSDTSAFSIVGIGEEIVNPLTVSEEKDFEIVNKLPQGTIPANYSITTEVQLN